MIIMIIMTIITCNPLVIIITGIYVIIRMTSMVMMRKTKMNLICCSLYSPNVPSLPLKSHQLALSTEMRKEMGLVRMMRMVRARMVKMMQCMIMMQKEQLIN